MSDDTKYRPLWGGTKIISSKSKQPGTLGCLAIDNVSESVVLLSCYSVLMNNNEQKGHQVAQPEFCCDSCCCRCGEIAKLERGAWFNKNVDCAIATLSDDLTEQWTNEVKEIGFVTPVLLDPTGQPVIPLKKGDVVFKRGIDTQLTEGRIHEVGAEIDVTYNTPNGTDVKTFTNQIIIKPQDPSKPFSTTGDIGAVVVDELNQIIGLLISDNTDGDTFAQDGPQSFVNPIQDVIKALDITIPSTGTLETLPIRSNGNVTKPPKKNILDELEKTIEQHTDGPVLISAFKKHRQEVMQLINTDREVKVAWNRYHGPSYAAHLMKKIKDRGYTVPIEIENVSYQRLLSKMSVILEKKGSAEMAADIGQYSAKAFLLIANLIRSFNGEVSM
jgi:hypothetical protein